MVIVRGPTFTILQRASWSTHVSPDMLVMHHQGHTLVAVNGAKDKPRSQDAKCLEILRVGTVLHAYHRKVHRQRTFSSTTANRYDIDDGERNRFLSVNSMLCDLIPCISKNDGKRDGKKHGKMCKRGAFKLFHATASFNRISSRSLSDSLF